MPNLVRGNPGRFRVANCGVHGSFRLSSRGYPDFDEPPDTLIQGTSTVALVAQFLKGLPDTAE